MLPGMNPDDPDHVSPTERTRFWRTNELGPVEWLAAEYMRAAEAIEAQIDLLAGELAS